MTLKQAPIATAEMLIRKSVAEVFEAFINPEITSKFWFTNSSGKLETGKQITWTWEMYNVSTQVLRRHVLALESPQDQLALVTRSSGAGKVR